MCTVMQQYITIHVMIPFIAMPPLYSLSCMLKIRPLSRFDQILGYEEIVTFAENHGNDLEESEGPYFTEGERRSKATVVPFK